MKILFCLILTGSAIFVKAQNNSIRVVPKNQQSVKEVPEWIDTTNMHPSKYGNVARLTYDNMPCIMPYNNTKKIPNPAKGKQIPSDMPNAWKYRNQKLADSIKIFSPYPEHLNFFSVPGLRKKNPMPLPVIPKYKK